MAENDPLSRARQVIREEVAHAGLRISRILLFDSRARGEAQANSDWDFYVVVHEEMDRKTRWRLASRIALRLARQGIVADVFLQSERTVREHAKDTGRLCYYALKEGIPV